MTSYNQRTYYELLEVPVDASADDIVVAYRRASELDDATCIARYELDSAKQVGDVRKLVHEAMEFLTDPDLRIEYDRSLGLPPKDSGKVAKLPAPSQLSLDIRASTAPASGAPAQAAAVPVPRAPYLNGVDGLPAPARGDGVNSAAERHSRSGLDEAPMLAEESAIASAEAALAQVSARAQQGRRPIEIPPDADFNGELLRKVRESKGLTLLQLSERTRVSLKHLENIEADRHGALPATVYLRGIVMNLARELKLDPVRVARSYIATVAATRDDKSR